MTNLIKLTSAATPISLLSEGQASGEITQNQMNNLFDLFAGGITLVDRDILATPGSPSNGEAWLIPASGTITGDWSTDGAALGDIAVYLDGWLYVRPAGYSLLAFVTDEKILIAYSEVEGEWFPVQELWSTTEHWTGRYDGADKVYSKTLRGITAPTASATVNTAHSITGVNLTKMIRVQPFWFDNLSLCFPAPAGSVDHQVNGTNFILANNVAFDFSGWSVDVRLEYTKT